MKTAVIDIGSNSVRLMMWADGKVLYKQLHTTRLGEGTAFAPVLKAEAIERTALAVRDFYLRAKGEGACEVFAYATEAVRSAKNGNEFTARVKALTGLEVEILSGDTEAELGLFGALKERQEGGIIDVGGASTEVCFRKGGRLAFSDDALLLQKTIAPHLEIIKAAPRLSPVFGVGGTATTIAALRLQLKEYSPAAVQGCHISIEELAALTNKLLSLSAEERKALPGMDVRRADIIAGGAYLLTSVLRTLQTDELIVSDSDNLEGYLAYKGFGA